jgi:hypothetical protein
MHVSLVASLDSRFSTKNVYVNLTDRIRSTFSTYPSSLDYITQ